MHHFCASVRSGCPERPAGVLVHCYECNPIDNPNPATADLGVMQLCCGRDVDGLWTAFLSYLEAAQGDDDEELTMLEEKLREIKQKLADKRYLQGNSDVTSADLALVRPQVSFRRICKPVRQTSNSSAGGECLRSEGLHVWLSLLRFHV